MPILTLKLPEELDQRLAATARRRGVTRSQLVREAIAQSLDVLDRSGAPASCLARARDLVGVHEGSRSLSHDPKHLKGYGG
jgi:hypothetical protein